jgi:hypothetical protein
MVEDHIMELIQRELDGTLSDRDAKLLQQAVDADAEVRRYRQELRVSVLRVASLPRVDPPPQLKGAILQELRTRAAKPSAGSALRTWFARAVESRPAFNYVYAFSAGIILGVALYGMLARFDRESPGGSEVSGAFLKEAAPAAESVVEEVRIDTLSIAGVLRSRQSDGTHIADLDLRSESPVRTMLEFDQEALCLAGFSQSRQTPETIEIRRNTIALTTSGSNTIVFLFEARSGSVIPPPVRITLQSAGGTVQRSLELARRP